MINNPLENGKNLHFLLILFQVSEFYSFLKKHKIGIENPVAAFAYFLPSVYFFYLLHNILNHKITSLVECTERSDNFESLNTPVAFKFMLPFYYE